MTARTERKGLTADALRWPGADRDRALAAAINLVRAQALLTFNLSHPSVGAPFVRQAGEHLRLARGYLGAIGFESGCGLWR